MPGPSGPGAGSDEWPVTVILADLRHVGTALADLTDGDDPMTAAVSPLPDEPQVA